MELTGLTCVPKSKYLMYMNDKGRNSVILICIDFQVTQQFDHSVVYLLYHYAEQPPVDVQLAGLMCGPKYEHMMYIKVETDQYEFVLPCEYS